MVDSGFLSCQRHHMAVYRSIDGGQVVLQVILSQDVNDVVHQSGISSRVTDMTDQLFGNIDGFDLVAVKRFDLNGSLDRIALQFSEQSW